MYDKLNRGRKCSLDNNRENAVTEREKQGAKSKKIIYDATIRCLDKYGYAKTSTSRITQEAGISRGALTHHFATKEDLIVETTNRILRPTVNPPKEPPPNKGQTPEEYELSIIKSDLIRLWQHVVNTPQGRALLEILVAYRTDEKLKERIKPDLILWNDRMQRSILQNYILSDGDDSRFERVWQVARVFYRGLITHDAFLKDPAELDLIIEEFVNMLAPMMQRRHPEG